jgi:hypothetical protein
MAGCRLMWPDDCRRWLAVWLALELEDLISLPVARSAAGHELRAASSAVAGAVLVEDRREVLGSRSEVWRSPALGIPLRGLSGQTRYRAPSGSVSQETEPLLPGRQTPPRTPSTLAAATAL